MYQARGSTCVACFLVNACQPCGLPGRPAACPRAGITGLILFIVFCWMHRCGRCVGVANSECEALYLPSKRGGPSPRVLRALARQVGWLPASRHLHGDLQGHRRQLVQAKTNPHYAATRSLRYGLMSQLKSKVHRLMEPCCSIPLCKAAVLSKLQTHDGNVTLALGVPHPQLFQGLARTTVNYTCI